MPGIDGYETCRRLKNNELSKDTPVIFVTAEAETVDKVRGLEMGAVDYITKPFQPEEVAARVERHLTIRNLQKRLEEQNAQLQQEINKRKRADEALQESQKILQVVSDNIQSLIFIKDLDGRYLMINKAYEKALNIKKEDVIGKNDHYIFPYELATRLMQTDQRIMSSGKPASNEENAVLTDGKTHCFLDQKAPLFDTNGEVYGLCGIGTDITHQKETEEELRNAKKAAEAANQAKSVFLANMSHELRSPLNAILGFSGVLDRSPVMPPEDKEHLAIIRRSGEHLLNLINDVLDMSKIEAGRTVLSEQNINVYHLLDDVEAMFRLQVEKKGLRLLFERDAGVPRYIRTDEIKLRQVLVNLLGNALKFTRSGGVTVRIKKTSEVLKTSEVSPEAETSEVSLNFEVEDTGEGIAPDELDSVFDAFVQSDSGRQSQEGTGLGLPISRKFVQMMGGDMTVESEVGRGSVFSFRIQTEVVEGAEIETALPERRVIALEPDQPR